MLTGKLNFYVSSRCRSKPWAVYCNANHAELNTRDACERQILCSVTVAVVSLSFVQRNHEKQGEETIAEFLLP
jgi:hypothetical protein